MILMLDNYDSFTYNLYQQIGKMYSDIKVVRNDAVTLDDIEKLRPEALIVSPGPGTPDDAGICVDAIKHFSGKIPIFGICLGEQSIGQAFGGVVTLANEPLHGKATKVHIDTQCPIFDGLTGVIEVGRYHSLIVERETLPDCLEVIAEDDQGQIMALRHREHPTFGIQFHPESVLTPAGGIITANFLRIAGINIKEGAAPKMETEKTELKQYIGRVVEGQNLSEHEAFEAMNIIMQGQATDAQIASFATALRMKGETIDEITGCAKAMRANATALENARDSVDIVGTGGDKSNTFNISTTSSFVIGGCGQKVAKHGNRSVSSKSGAADVLEALGVKITSTPEKAAEILRRCGVAFLFAQNYHGSMRFAGPARRETGIRTVFNILGPLTNPAFADYIVAGCYDAGMVEPLCRVFKNLGLKRAMVVHGGDGLDEITVTGDTQIAELLPDGNIVTYVINPSQFGMATCNLSELVGGTAEENAEITRGILTGKITGAKRDIVVLNSACALYITGKAASISEGVEMAKKSIDDGSALKVLEKMIEVSNS